MKLAGRVFRRWKDIGGEWSSGPVQRQKIWTEYLKQLLILEK